MGITRQIIFTVSPDEGVNETLSFAQVVDGNALGKAFTCAYIPPSKGSGINLMQETVFLGTTSGVGLTFQSLRDDKSMDGSSAISATLVTQRIDPAARSDTRTIRDLVTKRYLSLMFDKFNPRSIGATLKWAKDVDPLRDPIVTWNDFVGDASDLIQDFDTGLAEWVHLKIEDSTNVVNEPVLQAFAVDFYTTGGQEGSDS